MYGMDGCAPGRLYGAYIYSALNSSSVIVRYPVNRYIVAPKIGALQMRLKKKQTVDFLEKALTILFELQ
jgi:hypothetical protein